MDAERPQFVRAGLLDRPQFEADIRAQLYAVDAAGPTEHGRDLLLALYHDVLRTQFVVERALREIAEWDRGDADAPTDRARVIATELDRHGIRVTGDELLHLVDQLLEHELDIERGEFADVLDEAMAEIAWRSGRWALADGDATLAEQYLGTATTLLQARDLVSDASEVGVEWGVALVATGEWKAALSLLESDVRVDPAVEVDRRLALGEAYGRAGMHGEAREAFGTVAELSAATPAQVQIAALGASRSVHLQAQSFTRDF